MPKIRNKKIDKVRASRDGHEFHEAWAARQALGLVLQVDNLIGIAVEGLEYEDEKAAPIEAVDIADLTFYYGKAVGFKNATKVKIIQVKYSKSKEFLPFNASDVSKTIQKFGVAFRSKRKLHGIKEVSSKLEFALVTNRPVSSSFKKALEGIISEKKLNANEKKQSEKFKIASGLKGKDLQEFASKFSIVGSTDNLKKIKGDTTNLIADWSAGRDSQAMVRIKNLRELVRDKAGLAGQGDNTIRRVHVLGALDLCSEKEILPFPPNFPKIDHVVPREQLIGCIQLIPHLEVPLLIHAGGGTGKTVFLESIANALNGKHLCVCFDCFAGGAYRAPEDGRHRPQRGLTQIVNTLACLGLCDLFLPTTDSSREALFSIFRSRLTQAIENLQRRSKEKKLIIIIDAIDNASIQAEVNGEDSFPKLILQSLETTGLIKDVKFVVSCRTHRKKEAKGDVHCEELELKPFSKKETKAFLLDRVKSLKEIEITVAQARSLGNPRVLEHLVKERQLLEVSQADTLINIDELIKKRIESALAEAKRNGCKLDEIESFLAGLSILPPPVPIQEYADIHGMNVSAIHSFAVDLSTLLEQSKHGLIFRDEPTETYILEKYKINLSVLRSLADNLLKSQKSSIYAANVLPALFERLNDGQSLFDLAFNKEIPASITSEVGKQRIRYSRISAAVLHAAREKKYDFLIKLLVELATVSAANQRGVDYLVSNPELVVLLNDTDAIQRLLENRTNWPGKKHARASIVLTLSQDLDEGMHHAYKANEWFQYSYELKNNQKNISPTKLDIAAIPFCLIASRQSKNAVKWLKRYYNWYGFEVMEHLFRLLEFANKTKSFSDQNTADFVDTLEGKVGLLVGALSFFKTDKSLQTTLLKKLAIACKKNKTSENFPGEFHEPRSHDINDGLLKSAALATSLGLKTEANEILKLLLNFSMPVYLVFDRHTISSGFRFLATALFKSISKDEPISFHSLLPNELIKAGLNVPENLSLSEFKSQINGSYQNLCKNESSSRDNQVERFISEILEPLHELLTAFGAIFIDSKTREKKLINFIQIWDKNWKSTNNYLMPEGNSFFKKLGEELLQFLLWSEVKLKDDSTVSVAERLQDIPTITTTNRIQIVSILAKQKNLNELAGKLAFKIKTQIESEDDTSTRSRLFSELAKAMISVGIDEAKSYFQSGLDQMEAIGSGDYQFTSELLKFTTSLSGDELNPCYFHTFTNLFELNMGYDSEKLPWGSFSMALTKISGCRGLAKLARWHDRNKASFEYSLLPYLYALVESDKIDPALALGLMRLSEAAELYECNTKHFAELIEKKNYSNKKILFIELIEQFERNHPSCELAYRYGELGEISKRVLGATSEISKRLNLKAAHFRKIREEQNDRTNYRKSSDSNDVFRNDQEKTYQKDFSKINEIASKINPFDEQAISTEIDLMDSMSRSFDLKKVFLQVLRTKVGFSDRSKYFKTVARLKNLELYLKIEELSFCKSKWDSSSQALVSIYPQIATTLIEIHSSDLINHDHFSDISLDKIAVLCDWDLKDLALEVIKTFVKSELNVPSPAWLQMATVLSSRASKGEGEIALQNLLESGTAKLCLSVSDGAYQKSLYPEGNTEDIAAGLTWFMLGSPSVNDRWRASHALRTFASFGKWQVIALVLKKIESVEANSFQAPELNFYFFHARLWLHIALSRLAVDYPEHISKFKAQLKKMAFEKNEPHILLKYFSAKTLLTCYERKKLKLSVKELKFLETANKSAFKAVKSAQYDRGSLFTKRPDSHPKLKDEFGIDYNFDKYEVNSVARLFNVTTWEINDRITKWVRTYDTEVKSMYASGGRELDSRESEKGINARRQSYGSQLGWHGLNVVVGQLLASKPLALDPYDNTDQWGKWLASQTLTRSDGLWLSDGMDHVPLETQINLFGSIDDKVTSDKNKLLSLLRLQEPHSNDLVLSGGWNSPDEINVSVSSAFVLPDKANEVSLELARADGFNAWLPVANDCDLSEDDEEGVQRKTFPCIENQSKEGCIDEYDPLGSTITMWRPQFSEEIIQKMGLKPGDPFKKTWIKGKGDSLCYSEAWGSSKKGCRDEIGKRFICSRKFLSEVLAKQNKDLLILILLRKSEKNYRDSDVQYWHTTAVVHFTKNLVQTFYPGLANVKHTARW